jgi:EthD domain
VKADVRRPDDVQAFIDRVVGSYGSLNVGLAEKTNILTVNDYDGTAEIWFDSLAGLEAVLTSATYKAKVFPDEVTFLDHGHTLMTIGDQVQIIGDYVKGTPMASLVRRPPPFRRNGPS